MNSSHKMMLEILEALADSERVERTELAYNLSDYVDPQIFENLARMEENSWTFTFRVEEHEVLVTSEGQLYVDDVLIRSSTDVGNRSGPNV